MREIVHPARHGTAVRVDVTACRQGLLDLLHLPLEHRGFVLVGRRIQVPLQVELKKTLVLLLQFDLLSAKDAFLSHAIAAKLGEAFFKRLAEPFGHLGRGHLHGIQLGQHLFFDGGLFPSEIRVVIARIVVGASVVGVDANPAVRELALDTLAGDHATAVFAEQQTVGEGVGEAMRPAVLALEDIAAKLKGMSVDQGAVLTGIHLPTPDDVSDVEAVGEHVGDAAAAHPWRAGAVDIAFAMQLLADHVEGHPALRVELEYANDQLRLVWIRLDGFLPIAGVHVPIRNATRHPSLPNLLILALADLLTKVVAVVLANGGHHVEGQCPGRAGTELVVHKGHLHADGILELLHPHRVAHVTAYTVELMGEDGFDLHSFGILLHPMVHLIERDAFGSATGGFSDHELAEYRPSLALRLVTIDPDLRIQRVALGLLTR